MSTVYVSNNPCIKNSASGYTFDIVLFDSDGLAVSSPTIATGDFKISKDGGAPANITSPTTSGTAVFVALTQSEINCNRFEVIWVDAAGSEWVSGSWSQETVTATTVSDFDESSDRVRLSTTGLTDILATALTESYASDGSAVTLTQALYEILQFHNERNVGDFNEDGEATVTIKKRDGSTQAFTLTATKSSITRAS